MWKESRLGNHQMTAGAMQGDPQTLIQQSAMGGEDERSCVYCLEDFTRAGSARQNPSSPDSTMLRYIGGGHYGNRYSTHAPIHHRSSVGFCPNAAGSRHSTWFQC